MNNQPTTQKEPKTSPLRRQEYNILVIHPYDVSTDFLTTIYEDLDATVIRGNVSQQFLVEEIVKADQIIALGHGTPEGLLGFGKYVLDKRHEMLLASKRIPGIYVWCYAQQFVERARLISQFYTEMFISEMSEAEDYQVNTSEGQIEMSNAALAVSIRKAMGRGCRNDFADYVKGCYLSSMRFASFGALAKFNSSRFYQSRLPERIERHRIISFPETRSEEQMWAEISGYGKITSLKEQTSEELPAITVDNEQ